MSINGCAVNCQIVIFGDRSTSEFIIALSQPPVYYYQTTLTGPGQFPVAFDLSRGSTVLSINNLSYNEPGNSVSSATIAGHQLTVAFSFAPGSTEPVLV